MGAATHSRRPYFMLNYCLCIITVRYPGTWIVAKSRTSKTQPTRKKIYTEKSFCLSRLEDPEQFEILNLATTFSIEILSHCKKRFIRRVEMERNRLIEQWDSMSSLLSLVFIMAQSYNIYGSSQRNRLQICIVSLLIEHNTLTTLVARFLLQILPVGDGNLPAPILSSYLVGSLLCILVGLNCYLQSDISTIFSRWRSLRKICNAGLFDIFLYFHHRIA